MQSLLGRITQAAMLASLIGVAGGCTTTAEVESMRTMVEEAKAEAAQARAEAKAAQATADEALRKAESAEKCCRDTNEKIDRMFKRSMYK